MDLNLNFRIKNSNGKYLPNIYRFPELFKIITSKLHLTPLWTGVMIAKDIFQTNSPYSRFLFYKTQRLNIIKHAFLRFLDSKSNLII